MIVHIFLFVLVLSPVAWSQENNFAKGEAAYKEGNYEQAIDWYNKAAEEGDVRAQLYLSLMYNKAGFNTAPENPSLSEKWSNTALSAPLEDKKKAFNWILKMAEQGETRDQLVLGFLYLGDKFVPHDYKQCEKWLTKAAEQGSTSAQLILGFMYLDTNSIFSQNPDKALMWLSRAAEQGAVEAQSFLAMMYRKGEGVPANDQLAFKWYSKAAEQGDAESQFWLGKMYQDGRGVSKNLLMGFVWYYLSGSNGNEKGRQKYIELEKLISWEKMLEAEQLLNKMAKSNPRISKKYQEVQK